MESLRGIRYPNYQVVVVDNGSAGNDAELLRKTFKETIVVVRNNKNYGFAEGNNIGIRYALARGADYVLLLNNDTVVDSLFINKLVEVAEGNEKIVVLGPKIYCYYEPNIIWTTGGRIVWWLGDIHEIGWYKTDEGKYDDVAERDWVSGCAMLIKRSVLDKLSLLDPSFFLGGEDCEFCTRVKRAGLKVIYVPSSKIWHKVGRSRVKLSHDKESLRQARECEGFLGINSRLMLFRKCSPKPYLSIFFHLIFAYPKHILSYLIVHRDIESRRRLIVRLKQLTTG